MRNLILVLFAISLGARENPFIPSDVNTSIMITTNLIQNAPAFTPKTFSFPSDARELTRAVFYYKSLDGSIKEQILDINSSFDWHDEFVLKNIEPEMPTKSGLKDSFKFNDSEFKIYNNTVVILTKDEKIRDFIINKPDKIVIDFKNSKSNFKTYTKPINKFPIKSIVFGSHDGYYRVVLQLDGNYKYSIDQTKDGYNVVLK